MAQNVMDNFDPVEAVMIIEEALEIEISDDVAERCRSPHDMVNALEQHLSKQPLTQKAADLLRCLAKSQNDPRLADRLNGVWRRDQIAAIVHELFETE